MTGADPARGRSGERMDAGVREPMEKAFGRSFTDVTVQYGARADRDGAHAVTHGAEISFGTGAFDPNSVMGRMLIAHELAHVVQQRNGRTGGDSHGGESAAEADADNAASDAVLGRPVTVSTSTPVRAAHASGGWFDRAEATLRKKVEQGIETAKAIEHRAGQAIDEAKKTASEGVKTVTNAVGGLAASAENLSVKATAAVKGADVKPSNVAAAVSRTASAAKSHGAQWLRKQPRRVALNAAGALKGVAMEATGIVDTLAWLPQGGSDLARSGVDQASKAGWLSEDQRKLAHAAVGVAMGPLADPQVKSWAASHGLVDKTTGTIGFSEAAAGLIDEGVKSVAPEAFAAQPESGELFTPYEEGELTGAIGSQAALAAVGAKEVEVVLKAVSLIGPIKQFVTAVKSDEKGWYRNASIATSLIGMVLALVNLRSASVGNKITRLVLASGQLVNAVPPAIQLYKHYYDPAMAQDPQREAKLRKEFLEFVKIVGRIVFDIVRQARTKPNAAPAHDADEAGVKSNAVGEPEPSGAKPTRPQAEPAAREELEPAAAKPVPQEPESAAPKPAQPDVEAAAKPASSEPQAPAAKASTSEQAAAVTAEPQGAPKANIPEPQQHSSASAESTGTPDPVAAARARSYRATRRAAAAERMLDKAVARSEEAAAKVGKYEQKLAEAQSQNFKTQRILRDLRLAREAHAECGRKIGQAQDRLAVRNAELDAAQQHRDAVTAEQHSAQQATKTTQPASETNPNDTSAEAAYRDSVRQWMSADSKTPGYHQGPVGPGVEAALLAKSQGQLSSFNELTPGAKNAPVIDAVGRVAVPRSVKAIGVEHDGPFTREELNRINGHLQELQGTHPDPTVNARMGKTAALMVRYRARLQSKGAWPEALPPEADAATITEWLRRNSNLALAGGEADIAQVRADLAERIRANPEDYNLGPNPTQAEIESVTGRVESAGITRQAARGIRDMEGARAQETATAPPTSGSQSEVATAPGATEPIKIRIDTTPAQPQIDTIAPKSQADHGDSAVEELVYADQEPAAPALKRMRMPEPGR